MVDDTEDIASAYCYVFENEGHKVEAFTTSKNFLIKYQNNSDYRKSIGVVVLDLMIDERSGQDLLEIIKAQNPITQVIIVSARMEEFVKVRCLDAGADDYVDKSISLQELVSRVNSRMRAFKLIWETYRHSTSSVTPKLVEIIGDEALISGQGIPLTRTELRLLKFFIDNEDLVLNKQEIEQHVFNISVELDTNVVSTTIYRLRKKFNQVNYRLKDIIKLRKGIGWIYSSAGITLND